MVGWCGSECDGVGVSCQRQLIYLSLVLEGQPRVYHSRCVLASLISLMVLTCLAK